MGPTAAGKTALAVRLIRELDGEIISVDSALVYRGMDIGTAKPDAAILADAPHRLIDFLDPAETYSAAEFRRDALREMADIRAGGRLPVLVGGTGLYFRALEQGLSPLPPSAPAIRRRLEQDLAGSGSNALHQRLAAVDAAAAARIHPNDPQRILRALEVYEQTGEPISQLQGRGAATAFPYRALKFAVAPADRAWLHRRIEIRLRAMLTSGLIEEVAALRARGDLRPDLPSMRAVGYRQVWRYLDGECDRQTMQDQVIAATRQLAKRQLTWLRAERDVHWCDPATTDCASEVLKLIRAALN